MRFRDRPGKIASAVVLLFCLAQGAVDPTDWRPKFYEGLEARGEVSFPADADRSRSPCIELRHVGGAKKFGVEKTVESALSGPIVWTVSADVRCADGGKAGAAMEFFDAKGVSLGVRDGKEFRSSGWTRFSWTFESPSSSAAAASVHLLSLDGGSVRFTNVQVSSAPGTEHGELPLEAQVLPVKWNCDWNGGTAEFTSFADAPLPLAFRFKGDRSKLEEPALVLDIPDSLALTDAFTEHPDYIGAERPVSETVHARDGVAYRQLRFEGLRAFRIMKPTFAFERKLAVVLEPRSGTAFAGRAFRVYWRLADASRTTAEDRFDVRFVSLPRGLRQPKSFPVFSWRSGDRQFSSDEVLNRAAAAYEAAGLTTFVRPSPTSERGREIAACLGKRPVKWTFIRTFPDLWNTMFLGKDTPEYAALGVRLAERADGRTSTVVCPEYFNNDPAFHAYFRDKVVIAGLKACGLRAGDWVAFDFEPWHADRFCVCERCRATFSKSVGRTDTIPIDQIRANRDAWVNFRCRQTEASVAKFCEIVRAYDQGIRIADYDYIVTYGDPAREQVFYRDCAKNAASNEKWFDIHLCSYYHTIGLEAFRMMRNNARHLKKDYVPLGGIDGYGSYLRDGEVLTPRQIRQFALAAFVNGCPAIGFYEGFHYDGLQMLALMKARDQIAAVEKFPWGHADGTLVASATSDKLAFAASVADGEEAIALFNYDSQSAIVVRVKGELRGNFEAVSPVTGERLVERVDLAEGFDVDVPPEGVRFVVIRKRK